MSELVRLTDAEIDAVNGGYGHSVTVVAIDKTVILANQQSVNFSAFSHVTQVNNITVVG